MDDLIAFLCARWDEEERLASAGESWTACDETQGTRRVDVDHSSERVVACTRSWRGLHIARHDPARVLREVEAKRRILDEFARNLRAPVITIDGVPMGMDRRDLARRMVRLLALSYADHPAYRQEWAP